MKIIIFLIYCGIAIGQCHEHEHGHHHGHDHGHQHGHEHGQHHGHEHGHQHGHEHGHHEHEHEDLQDQAKFRYSKQANEPVVDPPAVEPVKPDYEEEKDKSEKLDHSHDHDKHVTNDHSHSHEDGHKDEQSHDHSGTRKDEDVHSNGGIHKDEHSHSHEDSHKNEHSHGHTYGHSHSHGDKGKKGIKAPVAWLEPLLATAMISAAPFLILFIVPLSSNSPESQPLLKVLLSFASGGLLGDAFLHLIPHAISPHHHAEEGDSHAHSHSHTPIGENAHVGHDHSGDMIVGLWVLAGIIAFLCVEKFVRFIKGGDGHSHSHHIEESEQEEDEPKTDNTEDDVHKMNGLLKEGGDKHSEESSEEEVKAVVEIPPKEIKVSAYLNLVADCSHNFTDGLAIGASFLVSRNVGLITTLTIFLHEIPHEIGDFAILIQSGCTKQKAMYLQLLTAIGAFAGCICGLLAEGLGTAASAWILPFTAGGFIYIATVSVIPELLQTTSLGQSIKEILGLLVGVFLMVIIALTE